MASQRRTTQKQGATADSLDGRFEEVIFKLDPRCPRPSKMVYVKRGLCPAKTRQADDRLD